MKRDPITGKPADFYEKGRNRFEQMGAVPSTVCRRCQGERNPATGCTNGFCVRCHTTGCTDGGIAGPGHFVKPLKEIIPVPDNPQLRAIFSAMIRYACRESLK